MKKPRPISIYPPRPMQAWEWALVYPAFWLIIYVVGPITEVIRGVERWPGRGNVYRGGL